MLTRRKTLRCSNWFGGSIYLGFDANNSYSVSTAIQLGHAFEEHGRIDHFEEPLPQYDLPGLRQVVDALDKAVSTEEQDRDRWRFRDIIMIANPDILQPDILNTGGSFGNPQNPQTRHDAQQAHHAPLAQYWH